MTQLKLSNEVIQEVIDISAWDNLSESFKWTEAMLEKYEDYIDWDGLSSNTEMVWTQSILDKYKHKINWDLLSSNYNDAIFTIANLERYKNYWNWSILSDNRWSSLTIEIIEKFENRWDWNRLINNHSFSTESAIEFLERYGTKFHLRALMNSALWGGVVEDRANKIIQEIIS